MKTVTILSCVALVVIACAICYWAGQNDSLTQAEADMLRAQVADLQGRLDQQRHSIAEPASVPVLPQNEPARPAGLYGLPVDVLRHPAAIRPGLVPLETESRTAAGAPRPALPHS